MLSPKAHQYLMYATGELLLVIAGILIALQINNWNEGRIEQNEIRGHALALSAAIERDMTMLRPVDMQIRASIRQSRVLADYLREREPAEMDNADLFFLTTHVGYRPYAWNRAELEQLKSAGGLRQMRNRTLATRISDYDALAQHLDQDYREDEESARAMHDQVRALIDLNYPPEGLDPVLNWDDGFNQDDIEVRLTQFRETDAFKRLAALERTLLSTDPAAFRQLANVSIKYASNTAARTEIELPRLRQYAAEIQAMIEAEYR